MSSETGAGCTSWTIFSRSASSMYILGRGLATYSGVIVLGTLAGGRELRVILLLDAIELDFTNRDPLVVDFRGAMVVEDDSIWV